MTVSALYTGLVHHTRMRPKCHALRYRCFWLLANLDELPKRASQLRLLSHNRFNVFSFHDADFGDRSGKPLRAYVEQQLAAAGVHGGATTICLLSMPRILGYAFNPISIYFCYRADQTLAALLYEVRNTFGERHSYLIPVAAGTGGCIEQSCKKAFYVSPFMDMDLDYAFRVKPPTEDIAVAVRASDKNGLLLVASLNGKRRPMTDRALGWLLFSHPLLTLKVIAAIHYEALWLALKGIGLRVRPNPPSTPVSIISQTTEQTRHHA
jgi:uncharacterized protein